MVSSNIKEKVKKLPQSPGVYIYKDSSGSVIYVGKAKNLKSRVSSYFRIKLDRRSKTHALVEKISSFETIEVESELEALILEAELIKKYLPVFNINLKDDKSYLYIGVRSEKVSIEGKAVNIETVETFRKGSSNKYKIYFGPYPDGTTVKNIVRLLRRVFPFRDCSVSKFEKYRKLKSPCLYGHINLCPAPCVNGKKALEINKKNVATIKKILSGKTTMLIKKLERDMKKLSTAKKYEEAASVRDVLGRFNYVRQIFRLPGEYLENPYLLDDLAREALEDLVEILPTLKQIPTRIECYDISNISGTEAVGSMVTAIDGRIDKREYKKFKIKTKNTPDDFAMIFEVIYRRLSHEIGGKRKSWGMPSLIILDGGKGQLSSAMSAMTKLNLDVPMVGLAKKDETVIYYEDGFHEISADKSRPGLKLLINLRDESHRFAQKYHHSLRSRKVFGTAP